MDRDLQVVSQGDSLNLVSNLKEELGCKHCGAPLGKRVGFCCAGCRSAYEGLKLLKGKQEAIKNIAVEDKKVEIIECKISGIHCAGCVNLIERLPKGNWGLLTARVNLSRGTVKFEFRPDLISFQEIEKEINGLGYTLTSTSDSAPQKGARTNAELYRIGVAGFCAMNTMMLAVSLFQGFSTGIESEYGELFRWVSLFLTLPVATYCTWPFYRNSVAGLKTRTIHIDLPLSLAIVAAFSLSCWNTVLSNEYVYFDSVCALVFLLLCGRYIQAKALERANREAEVSWSLLPDFAWQISSQGRELSIPTSSLESGSLIAVYPLERFPADGKIASGATSIDSSVLTGESVPQPAEIGQQVIAGTLNLEARVEVEVSSVNAQTRVGRLLKSLEEAERPTWGLSAFIDRVSAWFTVSVIGLAIIAGLFWANVSYEKSLEVAVTFLIVTCPCAFGIAAPLAVSMFVGKASKQGILIKSSDVIERIYQTRQLFLDKTGTITEGKLRVTHTWFAPDTNKDEVLSILRVNSKHPIAQAVCSFAGAGAEASNYLVKQIPSRGIEIFQGDKLLGRLGSERWFSEIGENLPKLDFIDVWSKSGNSIVYFSDGTAVKAVFGLEDQLKEGVVDFIHLLKSQNIKVTILSGDKRQTVEAIAKSIDVEGIGELMPEEKAKIVSESHDSCFIGDGVNDTLAMKAAGVSIGVTGGLKATLETADIFIGTGEIKELKKLFVAAGLMHNVIRRNLVFSTLYNVIGGGLALFGLMNPLIAALLMPASSITVISHSMLNQPFGRD